MAKKSPIWTRDTVLPKYPALKTSVTCDVCVVGAGLSGLSTAYLLCSAGLKVVVVEALSVLSGETSRTTAHLASALDDRFVELERLFGRDGARLAAESHAAAIRKIEEIVNDRNLDCDFSRVDGFLFGTREEDSEFLNKEFEAAQRAGLDVELCKEFPLSPYGGLKALRFRNQGQFHPTRYCYGLLQGLIEMGASIFEQTRAVEFQAEGRGIVTEAGYKVNSSFTVVCTNSPISDRLTIHSKQAPYRTYAISSKIKRGVLPKALYWDTLDPYHYIRLGPHGEEGFESLIIGGEDHKTGQSDNPQEKLRALESWSRGMFPFIEGVDYAWSGQVLEPIDGLAFIGRDSLTRNTYIATGDSGHGMTHATIAGMLITDLILERANSWEGLYLPKRKKVKALKEYAKENLNVAVQYADWVTGGDVNSRDEIPKSRGAIIRNGPKKIACYRDEEGALHELSAICTHLGCSVQWNDEAKSWDCPCHGSRFTPFGEVLNGPAVKGLKKISDEKFDQ